MPLTIRRAACLTILIGLSVSGLGCRQEYREPQPLHDVHSPSFERIPPLQPAADAARDLMLEWRGPAGDAFRQDLRTWQAAALAGSLLVILVAGVNWREPRDSRTADLLLLWAAGAFLFNSMRFFDGSNLQDPTYLTLLDWVFTAVTAISLALLARAVIRGVRPSGRPWAPSIAPPAAAVLAVGLLATNIALALIRPPDDAGFFSNLGGQRLRERGWLPYGDPLLTGTPGAAYGPLLYAAHVPFQIFVSPTPVNPRSPARPPLGESSTYLAPPVQAAQLCVAAFHLLGVAALFVSARRLAGPRTALAVVCLYCGSLAVLGIGGREYSVAGMTFVSHIAPAAATLLAFAALPRAWLSGVLLVVAAGVGFYPAFMGPVWLGYYWNHKPSRLQFMAGCGLTAVLLAGTVYLLSRPAGNQSTLATILSDTFGHHTELSGYGSSPFGFWGQRDDGRRTLMTPLAGSDLTTPLWLGMLALMLGSGMLARGRSAATLALLSAGLAIAAAVVKPHATGTYMAWYYGLFLLGLCGSAGSLPNARTPWRHQASAATLPKTSTS